MAEVKPVTEDARLEPISPYGSSKLMTEIMLRDTANAHPLRYVTLRYFNVAGADPDVRSGQSTPHATHLIKVAVQAALGQRPYLEVFGTDYPTQDGTCVRDYIHVSDLARAHLDALRYLRAGGKSEVLNCGYGRGFSVLDVIGAVKRTANSDFAVHMGPRRAGDPAAGRRGAAHQRGPWLGTTPRRPRHNRRPRALLGEAPRGIPRLKSRIFCLCSALKRSPNQTSKRCIALGSLEGRVRSCRDALLRLSALPSSLLSPR
jgi:UDP-glucose 4-epimerase